MTIKDAEHAVLDRPTDCHGFAAPASVDVSWTTEEDTVERMKGMLQSAGYRWAGEGWWTRPGFRAGAHFNRRLGGYAFIFVYSDTSPIAMATGREGFVHPGDRPSN
jgi:hypothetical protein